MKICTKCGVEKGFAAFSKRRSAGDGLQSQCKSCCNALSAAWAKKHPERMAELKREWLEKNREKHGRYSAAHRARHPEEVQARQILNRAVMRGKAVRPSECDKCQEPAGEHPIEGHHPDYSKPLEVEWLCTNCHRALHQALSVPSR